MDTGSSSGQGCRSLQTHSAVVRRSWIDRDHGTRGKTRPGPPERAAPYASVRTRAPGEVDVAVPVAVVFPRDVADATRMMPGDGQARAGLPAHARPGIVPPPRGRAGGPPAGA